MKLIFLVAVSGILIYDTCNSKQAAVKSPNAELPASKPVQESIQAVTKPDKVDFESSVKPILVKRCSPCHFTGGKMYEKLPFDKGATLLKPEVKAGILKRIKDENENAVIKNFIEQGAESTGKSQ